VVPLTQNGSVSEICDTSGPLLVANSTSSLCPQPRWRRSRDRGAEGPLVSDQRACLHGRDRPISAAGRGGVDDGHPTAVAEAGCSAAAPNAVLEAYWHRECRYHEVTGHSGERTIAAVHARANALLNHGSTRSRAAFSGHAASREVSVALGNRRGHGCPRTVFRGCGSRSRLYRPVGRDGRSLSSTRPSRTNGISSVSVSVSISASGRLFDAVFAMNCYYTFRERTFLQCSR